MRVSRSNLHGGRKRASLVIYLYLPPLHSHTLIRKIEQIFYLNYIIVYHNNIKVFVLCSTLYISYKYVQYISTYILIALPKLVLCSPFPSKLASQPFPSIHRLKCTIYVIYKEYVMEEPKKKKTPLLLLPPQFKKKTHMCTSRYFNLVYASARDAGFFKKKNTKTIPPISISISI